jgi:hypothetical protein
MGELVALLSSPAPEEVLADIAANNCFVRHIAGLDLPVDFATRLNTWDVRLDSTTGHYAISALLAGAELGDNAAFVHLHFDHEDEEGHAFWHVVDEFEADVVDGAKANVESLRRNHRAWLATSRPNHAPIPARTPTASAGTVSAQLRPGPEYSTNSHASSPRCALHSQ